MSTLDLTTRPRGGFAHYFAGRGRKYLVLTTEPSPSYGTCISGRFEVEVTGKREARAIATGLGARPWNF